MNLIYFRISTMVFGVWCVELILIDSELLKGRVYCRFGVCDIVYLFSFVSGCLVLFLLYFYEGSIKI